jgi:hypothetical protein
MFHFLRGIVLITTMMLNYRAAVAEDVNSANNRMVGCRAYLLPQTTPTFISARACAGG